MRRNLLLDSTHTIIIFLAYLSPLWLDYRLIICGTILYWIQIYIFKACVLAIVQYGNNQTSFSATWIIKLLSVVGLEPGVKRVRFFLDWILPELLIVTSIVYQVYFGHIILVTF